MKPAAVHITWLIVAAAAFAAGRFLDSDDSSALQNSQMSPPVVSAPEPGNGGTAIPDTMPSSKDSVTEAQRVVDQFRVSSTGHINPEGMRDAVITAIREGDPVQSSLMFAMLMEELTPENAEAARKAISETVSGWESFRFLGLLNYRWGAIDGSGAVAAAQASGDPRETFMGTAMALSGWATSDPDAALEWMESQKDGDNRAQGMWMRSLVTGLAGSDPNRATDLVAGMATDDPQAAQGYTESIARELLKNGLAEAEHWLASLDDPSMRKGAIETISSHLLRSSPTEALAWAANLDAGDGQNTSMNRIFREWSQRDPEASSQKLASLPEGTTKDYAINGLVEATRIEDPEAAVTWAATISDEELRNRTIIESGATWFRRDQEAAAAWLAGSDLSEQVQTSIIEKSTEQRNFDLFDAPGRGVRGGRN